MNPQEEEEKEEGKQLNNSWRLIEILTQTSLTGKTSGLDREGVLETHHFYRRISFDSQITALNKLSH